MAVRVRRSDSSKTSVSWILLYIGIIVAVECLARVIPAAATSWANAALIFLLLNHSAALRDRARTAAGVASDSQALLVLALVPLLKLVSASLPQAHLLLGVRPILAFLPLAAALVALRSVGAWSAGGPLPAPLPMELLFGLGGIPLSLACFLVARSEVPGATGHSDLVSLFVALAAIWILGALLEELIFRVLIQRALAPLFGRGAILLTACLFAAVYLGGSPLKFALFMSGYGALLGWWAYGKRSFLGVVLSHGLVLTGLVTVWPHFRSNIF